MDWAASTSGVATCSSRRSSQGATTRQVYLPAGQWYDWWTGAKAADGRTISREVNMATMPIYVRAGAIIPFDPIRQYASQTVDEPTTLKIYPGADGQFTLYEDDGISLDYLQGRATWTRMTWDDSQKRFVIEPGAPDGAVNLASNRTFRIDLLPNGRTKNVNYAGRRVEVAF